VKGKGEGYSNTYEVERNIQEFIRVKELDKQHSDRADGLKYGLGSGESETLMLALEEESEVHIFWSPSLVNEDIILFCQKCLPLYFSPSN